MLCTIVKTNEWLGAKLTKWLIRMNYFFHQKCLNFLKRAKKRKEKNNFLLFCLFLCVCFNILSLVFSETKCKSARKNTGECFTVLNWKAHACHSNVALKAIWFTLIPFLLLTLFIYLHFFSFMSSCHFILPRPFSLLYLMYQNIFCSAAYVSNFQAAFSSC